MGHLLTDLLIAIRGRITPNFDLIVRIFVALSDNA